MGWTRAMVLTALTLSAAIGSALEQPNEVPFKLYRGYLVVVRGSIGGLKNLNLLVDTGAVPSAVDERIAHKLHLRGQPERFDTPTNTHPTERVTVTDVEVGPSHVNELSVIVMNLAFSEEILGVRVDGLIGLDALGQSPFTIDYQSRKLVFGPVDPSFVAVPYAPGLPYALVLLHIQQETMGILVDTGASNLVLFQSGLRNCQSAIGIVGRETWTSIGGEMLVAKAQLLSAYLGKEAWGTRLVYIPENSSNQSSGLAGLLGTTALGKRVGFDPVRKVLAWEPN
jgi:hypothetical protein